MGGFVPSIEIATVKAIRQGEGNKKNKSPPEKEHHFLARNKNPPASSVGGGVKIDYQA